jgi:hypothetical protein
MWELLHEWGKWTTGVALPFMVGLGLIGTAIWARIHLTTYLPLIGKGVSYALMVAGATFIGYGLGSSAQIDKSQQEALVAQAERMSEANRQLQATITNVVLLQDRVADYSKGQQEFAAAQRGQTDDLIQKLASVPTPVGCDYSPDVRKRLLNIQIRRPPARPRQADTPG